MISIQLLIQDIQYITTVDRLLRGLVYCLFDRNSYQIKKNVCTYNYLTGLDMQYLTTV